MKTELSQQLAERILLRLGESGQPPERGLAALNVGNDGYLDVLRSEYFDRVLLGGSSFKLVQGYFGGGKTHFLHVVRELAWSRGFAVAVVELSPSECAFDDPASIYQSVARRIAPAPVDGDDGPEGGIGGLIRGVLSRMLDEEGDYGVERFIERELGRAACESSSFRNAVTGFARAWLVGDRAAEVVLEAWLMGEAVPASEIRPHGVFEVMKTRNGMLMLRSLVQMMVTLGFAGTGLFFDEADRTLSVSPKRSQAIGDNVRQIVDLCGRHQLPGTLVLYAVPPEFMRSVAPEYPALHQRLKAPMPLSVRSPQSVLIDLERLDMSAPELLTGIGHRIVDIFVAARGGGLDVEVERSNAAVLAGVAAATQFDVNHRRLFVKGFVDLLHRHAADGSTPLSEAAARELVTADGAGRAATAPTDTAEPIGFDDFADF